MDVKGELVIKKIDYSHCEKGPVMCPKCKEADQKQADFALMQLFSYSETPRPTIKIDEIWYSYDILQRFSREDEAFDYAEKNTIRIGD